MNEVTRRTLLGVGAGLAAGALADCAGGPHRVSPTDAARARAGGLPALASPTSPSSLLPTPSADPAATTTTTTIPTGDGSALATGPQPRQPLATPLRPGERPPQFVVVSWDGAGETSAQLFSRFREVSHRIGGSMTFFLSGIYLVPAGRRMLYRPPQHPVGASAIGFLSERSVHATIQQVGLAWKEGHEIGTHFNGHFCGPTGVSRWSPQDWDSEIDQAVSFVEGWRTTTGFTDLDPFPFDYTTELVGGRTPCLEGQRNLLRSSRVRSWRYDTSGTGTQVWPSRFPGSHLWNIPMQAIPFPQHSFEVISMDYNLMANQSGQPTSDPTHRALWRAQAYDAFMAGFTRAYTTNRAPLIIGNHFERWNGGIYMEAVEAALVEIAQHPDVRMVSFRQLVDWLEAQSPAVLARLQRLGVGHTPAHGDWSTVTA